MIKIASPKKKERKGSQTNNINQLVCPVFRVRLDRALSRGHTFTGSSVEPEPDQQSGWKKIKSSVATSNRKQPKEEEEERKKTLREKV